MNFSNVKNITIPDGVVVKITSDGVVLWERTDTNSKMLLYKNCYDNGVITPDTTYLKNNSIVSNTYENGQGVIIFKEKLTEIWNNAFYNKDSLEEITIPNSVTTIRGQAFYDCSNLVNVVIPNSVTSIGSDAFYACIKLKSITLPNSITHIEKYTFRYCTALQEVIIPDSVTSIGGAAFYYCTNLPTITIPSSVTSIGGGTFGSCYRLSKLICLNPIAPTLESNNVFENMGINASDSKVVYVPENSIGYTNTDSEWYKQLDLVGYRIRDYIPE